MALLPPNVDYTDRDFEAIRARVFNVIKSVFPSWDSTEISVFGNILVELFAYIYDILAYYQDNQARESRITTAQLRRNILGLIKILDYQPRGATASQVDVMISIIGGSPVGVVFIPANTVVRTAKVLQPVKFRTLELTQINVPEGENNITVTVENSDLNQEFFESTGLSDQQIVLSFTPFLDGSLIITAANGNYEVVNNLLSSTNTDRHCTVVIDEVDRAYIRFGNGINGTIPIGTISVSYRTGGGSAGVVDAGQIDTIDGTFIDEFGNPVTLSVTNLTASTDAQDRQSIEEIRVEAPSSIRAINRTVSREDYEINALQVPGVGKALMMTSNEDPGIDENAGKLYIVPTGGSTAPQDLLDRVLNEVTVVKPNTLTFRVEVLTAPLMVVNISSVIHLLEGFSPSVARASIIKNINDYFSPVVNLQRANQGRPQVNFGYNFAKSMQSQQGKLPWSDIVDEILDANGVRKIDDRNDGLLLNNLREDVDISLNQFPILGTITLINAATGQPL
jgi:hypothetical protein